MPLRRVGLSFLLLALSPAVVTKAYAQVGSARNEGKPTPNAAGGFVRDSRRSPHEPSRDNAFSSHEGRGPH